MDISNLIVLATEATVEHAAAAESGSGGVIGTLGLNWKLFLAQAVNFSIVVFVLWKWVFKPVAGALEARREKIEKSVREAGEIEKKLEHIQVTSAQELQKARQEAQTLIQKSQELAAEARSEATKNARSEAEKIMADAARTIEAEKERVLAEAKEELANLVVMASERVIKTKLDDKHDKKLINDVVSNIKQ